LLNYESIGSTPPLTLQENPDGISVVLHFGKDQPQEHVSAMVVTIISKMTEALSDFELVSLKILWDRICS